MERAVYYLHSYWAYLVVLVVLLATINAIIGAVTKKSYAPKDFRISLFALICTHIQLLIGIVLFFVSDKIVWFTEGVPVKDIMSDSTLRLYNVEHPLMMIIAIALITIGYSKHKKKLSSAPKFKVLAIFYPLALIAILAMIPWAAWF